ncbi:hypothetical protein B0G76_3664 [Paraburkholderia sp. BL23I1N1]|nr:hypothetical protein B0G76_3664 [Paraburkholderia sp. BL23I1N1]
MVAVGGPRRAASGRRGVRRAMTAQGLTIVEPPVLSKPVVTIPQG